MIKVARFFLIVIALWAIASAPTWADDKPPLSSLELKTMAIVDTAYEFAVEHSDDMDYVQNALENDSRFKEPDHELYIFMHCYDKEKSEAICCGQGARPELIGKNMWHLRTPNGRQLFHEISEIVEKDGQGWIEYDWLNPFTRTIQTKRSFVRKIILKDGHKAWIGSGFWKE